MDVQGAKTATSVLKINRLSNEVSAIEVTVPAIRVSEMRHGDTLYKNISIDGFSTIREEGKPALPVWNKYILLPDNRLPDIRIKDVKFKELSDYSLAPVQALPREGERPFETNWVKDERLFSQDEFYPGKNYKLRKVQTVRGEKITLLSIYPVQYNPRKKILKILVSFTIIVQTNDFPPAKKSKALASGSFSGMVSRLVLNPPEPSSVFFKEPANVLDEDGLSGCDYLIITHPRFTEAADSLAAWRRLNGLRSKITDTDETGTTAEDIRAYLQWAYDSWDIVPRYVLFLGDAEFVPTNYRTQHPSDGQGKIASDIYYVTLDGNDLLADMAFGRIPVNTALEALSYAQKVIRYEKNPPRDPSFYNQAEMLAYFQDDDNPDTEVNERDGYADRRFVLTSEEMRDYLLSEGYNAERIYYAKSEVTPTNYSKSYANGQALPAELLRSNGFAWDGNATQISTALNNGVFFVSHRDHGSRSGWGEPGYKSGNVAALTNGEKLPLVFSVNCQTGWYDNETDDEETGTSFDNECFVEYWLHNFLGGAIGVFGSTRISYSGYNDALVKGFFDAFWPQFLNNGDTNPLQEMGLALNYGKMYMAGEYAGASKLNVELEEFHYFGDPATPFRNRVPQEFYVQTPENLSLNQTELVVQTGVAQSRVTLVQGARMLASALSDLNGQAVLELNSIHSQENIQLCVTKANYRPWLRTLSVRSPQDAGVSCLAATISDQNGDDTVNMGEEISWNLQIHNNDTAALDAVELSLLCENEQIILLDSVSQITRIEGKQSVWNRNLRFKVSNRCPDGTTVTMQLTVRANPDILLQIPLYFSVEQGLPEMELSSSLVAATVDSAGETEQEIIYITNRGFGVLQVDVKDKAREFISPGDTLNPVWDNVPNGIGNIYEISEAANLLRFSTYISVTAAANLYFFVYEGDDFKGLYHKIAQSDIAVGEAYRGYLWSKVLNVPLRENHFYYIGVSWEGNAAVSRMNLTAPVAIGFGALKTGCLNLGGVPPQEEVNQVVNLFTPYLQQLETGQGDWLSGVPFSTRLNPAEQSALVLNVSATASDTLLNSTLLFSSNDPARDTVSVPIYLNVADSSLGLAVQAGRLQGEDGSENLSPGKMTDIPVILKNIGSQTLNGISARFDCPDSTLEVQNRLITYAHLNPAEQVSDQAFKVRTGPEAPLGKKVNYRVFIHTENGYEDTLRYHKIIRAGVPELLIRPDSIKLESAVLHDTLTVPLNIQNNGFASLQVQLQNPLRHQINCGSLNANSWWPDGSGFGNVLYQVSPQNLQAARYYVKTDAETQFYFFVFEGSALKGDYTLICSAGKQISAAPAKWIESPPLRCLLKTGYYYYIGISWQGSASVGRAVETVPYQTDKAVVYSSAYKLGGAPPQTEINQPYKVSYPVAQQLITGQGLWLDWDEDTMQLLPGEQKSVMLRFISTQPETTLSAQLTIGSNDPQNEIVTLPLEFTITAGNTAITEEAGPLPQSPQLNPNFPNPFNGVTRISYSIARRGFVRISIFNTLGQRVKNLLQQKQEPGHYHLTWQGRNERGKFLSSGVYFLVLKTQGRLFSRKIILLK